MNASRPESLNLKSLKQALASEESVVFAYLFGSHATGDASPLSDVDVAVYPDKPLDLDERLGLIYRLIKKTRLERLDLTFLNRVHNLYLLEDILDHGIVLLDRDPDRRAMFEVMTHHRFLDFQYTRKLYLGE